MMCTSPALCSQPKQAEEAKSEGIQPEEDRSRRRAGAAKSI